MPKDRITVILGAGAMFEATGVSTASLTEKIIKECKEFKIDESSKKSLVDVILEQCKKLYYKETKNEEKTIEKIVNFEDIFHVLELLESYSVTSGYKVNTSAYKIFSELKNEFCTRTDNIACAMSIRRIIEVINSVIYSYDCKFQEKGMKFKHFFEELINNTNCKLDVFNLNYDTWVEQSLGEGNYNDGFVKVKNDKYEIKRFDLNEYLKKDNKHTVSHLHGQIKFEYPDGFSNEEANKNLFKESLNTLYKYEDYDDAKYVRDNSGRSADLTQSGEFLRRTNIITGLMKTEKLLWNPLIAYHNKLANALVSNSKLIIIGYGYSDLYLNELLYQYQAANFDDRRIVMIDYFSKEPWEEEYVNTNRTWFTKLFFKNNYWHENYMFKPLTNVFYSEDNMACLYKNGFNDAINNIDKIINFIK